MTVFARTHGESFNLHGVSHFPWPVYLKGQSECCLLGLLACSPLSFLPPSLPSPLSFHLFFFFTPLSEVIVSFSSPPPPPFFLVPLLSFFLSASLPLLSFLRLCPLFSLSSSQFLMSPLSPFWVCYYFFRWHIAGVDKKLHHE